MSERPILFSAPMVLAILDGRKTVTRRVVSLREFQRSTTRGHDWTFRDKSARWQDYRNDDFLERRSPYGKVGDRLWVRETCALGTWWWERDEVNILFRATDPRMGEAPDHIIKLDQVGFEWADRQCARQRHGTPVWSPASHMPRIASRLTLEVTGVRVERLQEITEEDAKREGLTPPVQMPAKINGKRGLIWCYEARDAFARLWDALNGKRHGCSWAANPWVWVVAFKRVEQSAVSGNAFAAGGA